MIVTMAGVDHSTAPLEIRERFAFTRATAQHAMQEVLTEPGVTGCVILSTCNRTELWLSHEETLRADPAGLLCTLRGVLPEEQSGRLLRRAGKAAARHLMETASGINSRVFGEDQIVAQVGAALALSRECGCAGPVLERLFREAVTAAKRVKTTVRLAAGDASAPGRAAAVVESAFPGELSGLPCLVIGNGEMGQLAARELLARGCRVQMTLRSYKRGAVRLPQGCVTIPYEERYTALRGARVVLSATSSPHHTLHYDAALPFLDDTRRVFIDLAVPRDISVRLASVPGVTLYDIDSLAGPAQATGHAGQERLAKANAILEQHLAAFTEWLAFAPLVPLVHAAGEAAARDVALRLSSDLHSAVPDANAREALEHELQNAVRRVAEKLLYGLRGAAEEPELRTYLEQMKTAAERLPAQYALRAGEKENEE